MSTFNHFKTSTLSFSLFSLSVLLGACGGSGSQSGGGSLIPTPTGPTLIAKSDWQNINLQARDNASSLQIEEQGTQLVITVNDVNLVSGENIQIYLDTDNNPKTGYRFDGTAWSVSGVDYIIENGHLFKSTANDSSWSWNTEVGEISSYTRTENQAIIVLEKNLLQGACAMVNAGAMSRDVDWQISSMYPVASALEMFTLSPCSATTDKIPPVLTLKGPNPLKVALGVDIHEDPGAIAIDNVDGDISSRIKIDEDPAITFGDLIDVHTEGTKTVNYSVTDTAGNTSTIQRTVIVEAISAGTILIDGNKQDWDIIPTLYFNAAGNTVKVTEDIVNGSLFVAIEKPNLGENVQIFIDSDAGSSTGYPLYNGVGGADYLVENNHLNKSLANSYAWSWKYDAFPIDYVRNGDFVEFKIPSSIMTSDVINFSFASVDANWNKFEWFNDIVSYSLLDGRPNNAPNAVEDSPTTTLNTPILIDALANDTDPDVNDQLHVISFTQPSLGSVTLIDETETSLGRSAFLFDPKGNVGSISFSYTISDEFGAVDSAVVTVAVTDPNDNNIHWPVITGENVSTPINTPIFIDVLANDTDLDNDTLILDQVDGGSHGITSKINGGVLYTPEEGFTGTDSFYYGVHDGHGHNGAGLVTVTITP